MTWMLTATGGQIDLRFIRNEPVDILDIAHHISQLNRYTGAAKRPNCVAEHSILVADILAKQGHGRQVQFGGLMHDAHEAYIGEVNRQLKPLLGPAFEHVNAAAARHVRRRFGLGMTFAQYSGVIKDADLIALSTERVALMPDSGPPWPVVSTHPPIDWYDFDAQAEMSWKDWRDVFLQRFDELHRPD